MTSLCYPYSKSILLPFSLFFIFHRPSFEKEFDWDDLIFKPIVLVIPILYHLLSFVFVFHHFYLIDNNVNAALLIVIIFFKIQ